MDMAYFVLTWHHDTFNLACSMDMHHQVCKMSKIRNYSSPTSIARDVLLSRSRSVARELRLHDDSSQDEEDNGVV